MSTDLTDDQVEAMDDMGDFMHTSPPPFPSVASAQGIPASRAPTQCRIKGLQAIRLHGISITGRMQGQADADRNYALRVGSI